MFHVYRLLWVAAEGKGNPIMERETPPKKQVFMFPRFFLFVSFGIFYTSHSPSISPKENMSFSNENSIFGCAPAWVRPSVFLMNSSPNPN